MVSSKLVTMGMLCLVGTLSSARADNVNTTSGVICQAYNAASAVNPTDPANATDIDYTANGVWNRSTVAAREISCAVPRSTVPADSTLTFYIDAYNAPGTCTSCMVTLYHFTGVEAASQPVLHCSPVLVTRLGGRSVSLPLTWTASVSFPTPVPDDYVRVICTLPANHAGTIYGIRSSQP